MEGPEGLGKCKKDWCHEDTTKPSVFSQQNRGQRKESTWELQVDEERVEKQLWAGDV